MSVFKTTTTKSLSKKKVWVHKISLLAKKKNKPKPKKRKQLVQWKGYICIQAKRHFPTYTSKNPVEQGWAKIPDQPSKAQLTFHGGKKSTFLHTWKILSPSPQQYQLVTQSGKAKPRLRMFWTKKWWKKKKTSYIKATKYKKKMLTNITIKQNPVLSLPVAISFSCSLWEAIKRSNLVICLKYLSGIALRP